MPSSLMSTGGVSPALTSRSRLPACIANICMPLSRVASTGVPVVASSITDFLHLCALNFITIRTFKRRRKALGVHESALHGGKPYDIVEF